MVLVVGGTGELGGRVTTLLRQRDEQVRCLVRPGTSAEHLEDAGVEVVRGDLTDPASLARAVDGVDTVVATATAIGRRLAGAKGPSIRETDEVGMCALVDAAQRAGVGRFVYVSYVGVDDGIGFPLERAKQAVERRLREVSMRSVIVRPDAFQEIHLGPLGRFDIAKGKVAVIGSGDSKRRWVATDDVAALLAALAVEPDPPLVVEVGGPEALTRNEAIAVAERASGRRIKAQRLPRGIARVLVRALGDRRDGLSSALGTGLMMDASAATWDDAPLRDRGISPRAAREFLEEQARS